MVDERITSPGAARPRVFLSHSAVDVGAAREVRALLREGGISSWMAPDDVRGGRSWAEQVLEAVEQSTVVVVLVSAASNGSGHVARELTHAAGTGCALVPIRLEDVKPSGTLGYLLNLVQWVDAFPGGVHRHRDALVAIVGSALSGLESATGRDLTEPQPMPSSTIAVGSASGPARLPVAVNEFVGRDAEVETLQSLLALPGTRLVTLLGPGGVGKTRLALEVGRRLAAGGKHQVALVELAVIRDPEHVLPSVARAVGVTASPGEDLVDTLARGIAGGPVLVLLDSDDGCA